MRLLTLKAQKQQNGDVHLFNQSGQRVACYDRFRSNKPDRRYKFVMHNCFRYKLEWIDWKFEPIEARLSGLFVFERFGGVAG